MSERDERWQWTTRSALRHAKPGPGAGKERRIARALAASLSLEATPTALPSISGLWRPAFAFACLAAMLWSALPASRRRAATPETTPGAAQDAVWEGLDASEDLGPCSLESDCS